MVADERRPKHKVMLNFRDTLFKLEFIYSSSTGEEKGLNNILATLNLWSYLLYVQERGCSSMVQKAQSWLNICL